MELGDVEAVAVTCVFYMSVGNQEKMFLKVPLGSSHEPRKASSRTLPNIFYDVESTSGRVCHVLPNVPTFDELGMEIII